jgi:negative regulator of sigma E activity
MLAFAFLPRDMKPVELSVADGGGVSSYTFDKVGTERVKTPAGEFETLKIVRRKDGPNDHRSTEIWLAPEQGLIPVRIRVTEKDGSVLDQLAARISLQ